MCDRQQCKRAPAVLQAAQRVCGTQQGPAMAWLRWLSTHVLVHMRASFWTLSLGLGVPLDFEQGTEERSCIPFCLP